MGIGEPFDNYDNVMDFLHIINDAKGLAIGARHITVSTSGLAHKIHKNSANNGLQSQSGYFTACMNNGSAFINYTDQLKFLVRN